MWHKTNRRNGVKWKIIKFKYTLMKQQVRQTMCKFWLHFPFVCTMYATALYTVGECVKCFESIYLSVTWPGRDSIQTVWEWTNEDGHKETKRKRIVSWAMEKWNLSQSQWHSNEPESRLWCDFRFLLWQTEMHLTHFSFLHLFVSYSSVHS